jgi:hypothetical protein
MQLVGLAVAAVQRLMVVVVVDTAVVGVVEMPLRMVVAVVEAHLLMWKLR